MTKNISTVVYIVVMVAVVVGVDIVFFRHRFRDRLIANIGIILVFIAFYFHFFTN